MERPTNSPSDSRIAIQQALHRISHARGLIFGTNALVESVKNHLGCNYTHLAEIAQVTPAGVRRWRLNDSGDPLYLNRLIEVAKREAGAVEKGPEASPYPLDTRGANDATDAAVRSVAEEFKCVPIKEVETALSSPMRGLTEKYGIALASCKVAKVEIDGAAVRVTFTLQ